MLSKDLPDIDAIKTRAKAEAMKFAKDHTVRECLDKTVSEIKPCLIDDYSCRVAGKIFLKECLTGAKQSAGFCDEFPLGNETAKTGKWRINFCANQKGVHNIVCTNTFAEAEKYCAEINGKKSPGN
jgi:hypothetical protein